MIKVNNIVFWLYFVIPSMIKSDGCNEQHIKRNGESIIHLLGRNTPITPGDDIGFAGYSCFNADIFTLNGCKIGSAFHCGLFGEANVCGDQLADAGDLYVLNNGDIRFGGINPYAASVHPTLDGADGSDIWDFVSSLFATQDNFIDGTGRYKNIEGRRSLRGYISVHEDGTGSIDEYHILQLRCSKCDDDDDDSSDSDDDNQGYKAFLDSRNIDNSGFSAHTNYSTNYNMYLLFVLVLGIMLLLNVTFCWCYYRKHSKKIDNQLPGGLMKINSLST